MRFDHRSARHGPEHADSHSEKTHLGADQRSVVTQLSICWFIARVNCQCFSVRVISQLIFPTGESLVSLILLGLQMFRFLQNRKTDWLFLKKKWDWASGIGLLDLVRENFESVKSNPELHGFRFTSLFDWSRKLVPLSEPITSKTNTNHDLVTRVFLLFGEALVFTLSSHCLFLCSEWLSQLLWCLFDCQLKTALYKVK